MADELYRVGLPSPWNFAATNDGRVFFIKKKKLFVAEKDVICNRKRLGNDVAITFEETRTTSWLHPVTGDPVQTGYTLSSDLPRGWEKTLTPDNGILYYIDHVNLRTSFQHPITGETSAIAMTADSPISSPNEQFSPQLEQVANGKKVKPGPLTRKKSGSSRRKVANKPPEAKRSTESPVSMKGWLYKQESGRLKPWKHRWFVLSDFCLFYYRGPDEGQSLGSILLPSYKVNPCVRDDGVSKKFAFKAEHTNMRTYTFAAESKDEMSQWMNAMSLATILQKDPSKEHQFGQRPVHLDDDGGFRVQPRPVNVPQHSRSPYSDDWGSAPSSDNSEHVLGSPRGPAVEGAYPRPYQHQPERSEPMNNQRVPRPSNQDPVFRHDVQGRSAGDQGTVDPRYRHSGPSPPYQDPRYPDHGSRIPDSAHGSDPPQHRPHPNERFFQDPRYYDRNAAKHLDQSSPRSAQPSMPGTGHLTTNPGFSRPSTEPPPPPSQQRTSQPRSVDVESRPTQQPDWTPLQDMSNRSVLRDGTYPGQVKQPRRDDWHRDGLTKTRIDWSQDPTDRETISARQDPRQTSTSLPNHYNRTPMPPMAKHNTLVDRQRTPAVSTANRTNQNYTNHSPMSDGSSNYSTKGRATAPVNKPVLANKAAGDHRHNSPRGQLNTQPRGQPDAQQPVNSHDDPRRYFEPLTIQTGPIYENLYERPPQITVSDVSQSPSSPHNPPRPPLPATLRGDYIREMAQSRSPHTRQDMMNSSQLAARRQHEPLVFRYPTTTDQARKYRSSKPPAKEHIDSQQQQWNNRPMVPSDGPTQNYKADSGNYPESDWTAKRNMQTKSGSDDVLGGHSDALTTAPREIEQKERNRLQKYIDRSFKRLSVGDGLPAFDDEVARDKAASSDDFFRDPGAWTAPLGGAMWHSDRPKKKSATLSHDPVGYRFDDASKPLSRSFRDLSSLSRGDEFSPQNRSMSRSHNELSPSGLEKLGKMRWETRISRSMDASDERSDEDDRAVVVEGRSEGQQFTYWTTDGTRAGESSGGQPSPHAGNTSHNISTIPEDPHMMSSDLLTTKSLMSLQSKLASQGLRLSICASDLIGKSHEELVLLLIQLRRSQSRLRDAKSYCRSQLDDTRDNEKGYQFRQNNSFGGLEYGEEEEHDKFVQLQKQKEQLQKQMEVHKPLVNLVDNMVTMGSLYGGDNVMLASQYKKHRLRPDQVKPAKPMIEFSRKHQEDKLAHDQIEELRELTEDEVDLEMKLHQLYESDRELQEKSFTVQSLQEDKELLEKALEGVVKQEREEGDPREVMNLALQRKNIDAELLRVRQQLADGSKQLEEVAADNARIEHEVVLLRSRIHGLGVTSNSLSPNTETLKARQTLERELTSIQTVITGLSQQGVMLSQTMASLRNSTPDLSNTTTGKPTTTVGKSDHTNDKPYMETDIDTMQSYDISIRHGTDDRQSHAADSAGLRRTTAINNISSATYNSSSSLHHADRGESLRRVQTEGERQHVPRSHMDSDMASDVERQHGPHTYRNSDTPQLPHGSFSPGTDNHPRTYNKTAAPFGSEPHSIRSKSEVELHREPHGNASNMYRAASDDFRSSWQPDLTQEWKNDQYEPMGWQEELSPDAPTEYNDSYSARDSSDIDDNTKRFYGLLPREKLQVQTVRKVKKNECERRGRDRWRSPADSRDTNPAPGSQRSKSLPRRSSPWTSKAPQLKQQSYDDSMALPYNSTGGTRQASNGGKSGSRKSAASRLFPSGIPSNNATSGEPVNSKESVRRISDLFTPRPFTAGTRLAVRSVSASRLDSEDEADAPYEGHSTAAASTHLNPAKWSPSQPVSCTITTATVKPMTASSVPRQNSPNAKRGSAAGLTPREKMRIRRTVGSRFQTISSSEPLKLEQTTVKRRTVSTTAGDLISSRRVTDLPDLVRADINNPENFDDETINRVVLGVPEKIDIPDRYVPDSDDELTLEEKLFHEEKAQKLKKLLAAQSLQQWSNAELDVRGSREEGGGGGGHSPGIHYRVEAEKARREHMLDIRQLLAREVMQKSRQVAASRLSSTVGKDKVVDSDPEIESPSNDLYNEMTSHKMATMPLDQRQSFYT